jgi:glycerol-3-phosphate dehydrogenase
MLEFCKRSPDLWDIIIIGGGATGLGTAVDAASRGYRTLLLEQSDFAKGTSSRSTKLIHGGLRYLKQGNISLVIEALKERGLLCQNAPHLVSHLGFLVPYYRWWERPFYTLGITLYDLLAGKLGLEKSIHLSREQALLRIPTLNPNDLRGGVIYYDGQFDDARLAISLAQTAVDHGAVVLNYCPVLSLTKEQDAIAGVVARDLESGQVHYLRAKAVINATGVFSDAIRQMDDPHSPPAITPSQGVHLVLDRSFMPSDTALLIPQTDDGRILFCIPWHRHLLLGTTDTHVQQIVLEPKPIPQEIDFLLHHAARYLTRPPKREDVLTVFTGLRPLVRASGKATAKISRDHEILISPSGLITIAGGKWTTYRKMAEDVVDKAIALKKLPPAPCRTEHLRLHGYGAKSPMYGTDAEQMQNLCDQHPDYGHLLHPRLPYRPVEVIWAVRHEMARTLEDVLARRTRALFLDAKASVEIAPRVAQIMAKELGHVPDWEKAQVAAFIELAKGYTIPRT